MSGGGGEGGCFQQRCQAKDIIIIVDLPPLPLVVWLLLLGVVQHGEALGFALLRLLSWPQPDERLRPCVLLDAVAVVGDRQRERWIDGGRQCQWGEVK